jgi:hypothetical protein
MKWAEACEIAEKMGWTKNACWTKGNGYWRVPSVGADGQLHKLLKRFQMAPHKWKASLFTQE